MEAAAGRESGTEWRIVDVGGSRSQACGSVPLFPNFIHRSCFECSVVSYVDINLTLSILNPNLATWIPFFDDGKHCHRNSYLFVVCA